MLEVLQLLQAQKASPTLAKLQPIRLYVSRQVVNRAFVVEESTVNHTRRRAILHVLRFTETSVLSHVPHTFRSYLTSPRASLLLHSSSADVLNLF